MLSAKFAGAQIRADYTLANWKTWLSLTGTNSGDVTLAGAPNYLTIAGQVITLAAIDLSGSNATGVLAAARFPSLTGDVSNSGLSLTVGAIQNKTITLASGYLKYNGSAFVFDNSTFLTANQTITLSGDVSGSGTTAITATIGANKVTTSTINNAAVTLAKIANAGANSVLVGSGAAGTGTAYSEIALGSGLAMTGTTLSATGSGGSVTSVDVAIGGMTSSGAITTSGTITMTGALNVNRGGTGAATLASNGILYGNGTSAVNVLAVNATGTNKFLTQSSSAAPAWAALVSGDIPNNGANTTGSAATLTTPRAIYGNNFDGSAALAQIIASTYGGTGNGFTKFSGPASSEKTFTLPNASATILTDNALVTVAQGGIGVGTLASNGVLYGGGTGAVNALAVNSSATNNFLTQSSSGAPAWATIVAGDVPNLAASIITSGTLAIARGGTNIGSYTTGDILYASATNVLSKLAIGSTNQVLTVTGGVPVWAAASSGMANPMTTTGDIIYSSDGSGTPARLAIGTTGQFLGTAGTTPAWKTLAGTTNQITVSNSSGNLTLSTPQDIATASTPQFARLGLGAAADGTANLASVQSTATTNAAVTTNKFSLNCSGTVATNFGQQWDWNLDDATVANKLAGRIAFNWSTATDASRTSQFHLYCINSGSTTEYMRIDPGFGDIIFPTKSTGVAYISSGSLSTVSYSGVSGRVIFASNATTLTLNQTANFWWDNTNNRLSMGGGTNGNASYTLHPWLSDAATNAISTVVGIDHSTSGTPAAGYGSQILMLGQSSTTASQNMGALAWDWVTATHASRASEMTFWGVFNASSLTKIATLALTAATTSTLTLGVAGTTLGNLALTGNTSGTITITSDAAAGSSAYTIHDAGLNSNIMTENGTSGTGATCGKGTLVGGTATISTTSVHTGSVIVATDVTTGALTNVGSLTIGTIVNNTSFVVNSTNVLDTSNFYWFLISNP